MPEHLKRCAGGPITGGRMDFG